MEHKIDRSTHLDVHRGGVGRDDAWRLLQRTRGHHAVKDIVLCLFYMYDDLYDISTCIYMGAWPPSMGPARSISHLIPISIHPQITPFPKHPPTSFVAITSAPTGRPIRAAITPAVTWPAAPVGMAKVMRGRGGGVVVVSSHAGSDLVSCR